MWNNDNFTRIGNALGETVASDCVTMELSKLDATRIKIKTPVGKVNVDPMEVCYDVKNYTHTFDPVVLDNEVR